MKRCEDFSKYLGLKIPECDEGYGCDACWAKYLAQDPDAPKNACPRCSIPNYSYTLHGRGTVCDRDPKLPANVIARYFTKQTGQYIGIVWIVIANNAVRALEEAGYRIILKPREKKE